MQSKNSKPLYSVFSPWTLSPKPKKKNTFIAMAIKIFTLGQFVFGNKGLKEKEAFSNKAELSRWKVTV